MLHVAAVDFTAVKLLRPQLEHLADSGFSVGVTCGMSSTEMTADLARFTPAHVAFPRAPRPVEAAHALAALLRVVRDRRPALLHLHSPAAALAVRALPRSVWPRGMRLVYTVHGFLHGWPPTGSRDVVVQRLEQRQARHTDMLLFQSGEDMEQAAARRYRTRLRLLGNGVEEVWFDVPMPERGKGPLRVLYVGRLVREKGVLDLLEAMAGCEGVQLALAGSALPSDRDGIEPEARAAVRRLGLEARVTFLGMLTREELLNEVARHHAVVLPSYREGMPRSINEGLAAARPCLVTDIRGSRELVTTGLNGIVVPAGDVHALAGGLQELADLDPCRFAQLSTGARRTAEVRCRETAVFTRLVSAYAELGVTA